MNRVAPILLLFTLLAGLPGSHAQTLGGIPAPERPAASSAGTPPATDAAAPAAQPAQTISLAPKAKPDVIYVPTPQDVVHEMLKMAKVTKADVVYDLGCGDGRIVVTAAKDYGARGIGFDIDPDRVRESRANVAAAMVGDRVEIRQGDLFEVNLSPASVLTLYLLESLNRRLRPKIFSELKPGSRVVSHAFSMGEWMPDDQKVITKSGYDHRVYFWIVPANVSGIWKVQGPAPGGISELRIYQSFQNVSGSVEREGKSAAIQNGRVNGDRLTFSIGGSTGKAGRPATVSVRVAGDRIEAEGSGSQPGKWTAQRMRDTKVRIDESATEPADRSALKLQVQP